MRVIVQGHCQRCGGYTSRDMATASQVDAMVAAGHDLRVNMDSPLLCALCFEQERKRHMAEAEVEAERAARGYRPRIERDDA